MKVPFQDFTTKKKLVSPGDFLKLGSFKVEKISILYYNVYIILGENFEIHFLAFPDNIFFWMSKGNLIDS